MKLNLLWGTGHPLSGYTNIDPHSYNKEGVVNGDITKLDEFVEDSEATEILAINIIDYLPYSIVCSTISAWVKKLRRGGKIIIGGVEIQELCKIFSQKGMSIDEFLISAHGHQSNPWEFKASHMTIKDLESVLNQHGLKILKKRINGFKMSVEAQRI
jgi:hypothetical protein